MTPNTVRELWRSFSQMNPPQMSDVATNILCDTISSVAEYFDLMNHQTPDGKGMCCRTMRALLDKMNKEIPDMNSDDRLYFEHLRSIVQFVDVINAEPEIDVDLDMMNANELKNEVVRLRNAIREHRNQRGDDRCWMDDHVLYMNLPEKDSGITTLPAKEEFLNNCARYCERFWTLRQKPIDVQ